MLWREKKNITLKRKKMNNNRDQIRDRLQNYCNDKYIFTEYLQLSVDVIDYLTKRPSEFQRFSTGVRDFMLPVVQRKQNIKKRRPWNQLVTYVLTLAKENKLGDRMNEVSKLASLMKKQRMLEESGLDSSSAILEIVHNETLRKRLFDMFKDKLLPVSANFKKELDEECEPSTRLLEIIKRCMGRVMKV
jgi:hypothetical protein